MKSQSFKSFAIALVIGAAAFFGTVATVSAQSKLAFETKFDFQVGNDRMQAGKYELRKVAPGRFVLRSVESNKSRIIVSEITVGSDRTTAEQVTFNRYGERYFLRGLFTRRASAGIDAGESSAEKEIRKNDALLARNGGKRETVSVNLTN